jgi:hypothetical protein
MKFFLLSVLLFTFTPTITQEDQPDVISKNMVTKVSPFSVKVTMDHIIAFAVESDVTIIGRVNHGEQTRSVGRDIGDVEDNINILWIFSIKLK